MPSLRYVILHHKVADGEHWDLMLEQAEALATWRLPRPPACPQTEPIEATRIGDHRTHYLDYEGPVSRGRGEVARFDYGRYRLAECDDERWLMEFDGAVLRATFALSRVAGRPPECWVLRQV
jgi:hypothetical protein